MTRNDLNRKLLSYVDYKFTFPISCSDKGYKTKEEAKKALKYIMLKKHIVSISEFQKLIETGHTFCIGNVVAEAKNKLLKRYYDSTNLIVFDIDKTSISLDNILYYIKDQRPDIYPTIAYETFSCDNDAEIYKCRLVYVFDRGLTALPRKRSYKYLKELISSLFNTAEHTVIEFDKAMEAETQRCYATNIDKHKVECSGIVYEPIFSASTNLSYEDMLPIIKQYVSQEDMNKYYNGLISSDDITRIIKTKLAEVNIFWESIANDDILDALSRDKAVYYASQDNIIDNYASCGKLKQLMDEINGDFAKEPIQFINDHKDDYTIYSKSDIDFNGNFSVETPINYFDVNWCKLWKNGRTIKIQDGQRRRTKLSYLAEGLRLINVDITPDELFYNLYVFRHYYISNKVDKISNYELRNIAVIACKKTFSDILKDIESMNNRPRYIQASKGGSLKGTKHKQHKQQERTLWHILVQEGKSLQEVQEQYPKVSKKSYLQYKRQINSKESSCSLVER